MRIPGAGSASLHGVLAGPRQPASWLGVGTSAVYLLTDSSTVLAVVSHDAVRLPCAVVLPHTAAELALTRIAATSGFASPSVGENRIQWSGPAGDVVVECTRQWRPPALPTGAPRPSAVAHLRRAVGCVDVGLEPARVAALVYAADESDQAAAAAGLLGRGPGLTPSGDDVLAGFLIGARVFGAPAPGVVRTVADIASIATTALSAQLLHSAAEGECVLQLAEIVRGLITGALSPATVGQLCAVGHTSGTALAHGLLAAAAFADRSALTSFPARPLPLSGDLAAEWRGLVRHSTANPPLNRVGAP